MATFLKSLDIPWSMPAGRCDATQEEIIRGLLVEKDRRLLARGRSRDVAKGSGAAHGMNFWDMVDVLFMHIRD